jgi:hypothetical protein
MKLFYRICIFKIIYQLNISDWMIEHILLGINEDKDLCCGEL